MSPVCYDQWWGPICGSFNGQLMVDGTIVIHGHCHGNWYWSIIGRLARHAAHPAPPAHGTHLMNHFCKSVQMQPRPIESIIESHKTMTKSWWLLEAPFGKAEATKHNHATTVLQPIAPGTQHMAWGARDEERGRGLCCLSHLSVQPTVPRSCNRFRTHPWLLLGWWLRLVVWLIVDESRSLYCPVMVDHGEWYEVEWEQWLSSSSWMFEYI